MAVSIGSLHISGIDTNDNTFLCLECMNNASRRDSRASCPVVAQRTSDKFGRRLLFEGLNKLIHAYVRFELGFKSIEVDQRDTSKVMYVFVTVFGIQCRFFASQL